MAQTVVVLGASPKPERYSNKAVKKLVKHGHRVIPVHPVVEEIEGLKVKKGLSEISESVDTLTLYIGPQNLSHLISSIIQLKPKRVIMNPGAESEELAQALEQAGIPYLKKCTLVLLDSGEF